MIRKLLDYSREGIEDPDKLTPILIKSRIVESVRHTEQSDVKEPTQSTVTGLGIRNDLELDEKCRFVIRTNIVVFKTPTVANEEFVGHLFNVGNGAVVEVVDIRSWDTDLFHSKTG